MIKLRSCRHVLHNAQVGFNLAYSHSRMMHNIHATSIS